MIMADNAIIVKEDGGFVNIIPRCPFCFQLDNTWAPIGRATCVNTQGRTIGHEHCPHCGKSYKVTYYAR